MAASDHWDLVVIGAGPGGYVAAIQAAQLGARVALVEATYLGGTCLNVGCIPTKALIAGASLLAKIKRADLYGIAVEGIQFDYAKMKSRKDDVISHIGKGLEKLIQSNKIEIIRGFGKLVDPGKVRVALANGQYRELLASNIIVATGSRPSEIAPFCVDGKYVHNSTTILNISELPKRLLIVGGGYIGCEFASMFDELEVEVVLIEAMDRIIPQECLPSSQFLQESFLHRGIKILTSTRVVKQSIVEGEVQLELSDGQLIQGDQVLVAVGRRMNTDQLGLETAGIFVDERGVVPVNNRLQTNIESVYAIGDITGKWMLAHTASHQGLVAASNACGRPSSMDYSAVPAVIFTDPEVASVGYTLEKAIACGFNAVLGQFPFQALGKSQASIETEGFAQIVIDKPTGRILGAQVVGHEAGVLIAQMAQAIQNELTIECVTHTIHAHPTISEAWLEAAMAAMGKPLHLPPKKMAVQKSGPA